MATDESFKRSGSVPFTWEIQPGVPKPHHNQPSIEPSPTLRPPPAGAGNYFTGQVKSKIRSKSVRTRSDRNRFDWSSSEVVSTGSPRCFPPFPTLKVEKKRNGETEPEVDYTSDPETLDRWSTSTGKTLSSFGDSVSSSSSSSSSSCFGSPSPFSSVQSSPQAAGDAVRGLRPFLERWRI
ncbi:uncharacterized protein LOC122072312 [Macadamia integrifolia]|uniref:uncharacterized protein LOC122072312 n=1 Tax=Macadamia integrifolia TaxID=60698 RepID=UPI001C5001F3|nr:uncharacterized protein LOC122072312 [Macadamia integrifolia]